jgi:sialate O-acetylesterase
MKSALSSISIFILLTFILISQTAVANDYYKELPLKGYWKFKLGDNASWSNATFDDTEWKKIFVPARWEEEGYQGYDGYAWYRKSVEIPALFNNRTLVLELGCIDDVDEVFFNGTKIGQSGSFPPYYSTAYNAYRKYEIPLNLVKFDKPNIIAVRVYDSQLEGGIVRDEVRIGASDIAIIPEINLGGTWSFNIGTEVKESKSENIIVPGQWENQGFYNYDGYAVYFRKFTLPTAYANKSMVFLAGRIDDNDRLYINGKFIGETGDFKGGTRSDKHTQFRNYFIPDGILKTGENSVVIKVFDAGGEGGILEGAVGLITQENFVKHWRMKRKK